ncbi:MAG TPA: hypothetical protein VFB54_13875 [Burkholderiales bacterium]|nr:hypothetical protein [Burkholderiales bacterium]
MPKPRLLVNINDAVGTYVGLSEIIDDQTVQSSWSHPNVPVLVFADSSIGSSAFSFNGGPVGSGLPIEVLFWGSWWLSAEGVERQSLILSRLQAVIASPYFSELQQYGIAPPHWRGAKVVTKPGAPAAFNSNGDQQAVPDLIDDLIDDDVFPDPDDEQIAQLVFMPKGFTQSINANGAHTFDYDYEFPFDKDYYWVGWIRWFDDVPGESREDVIRTATHELVELLTDPEGDGWYASAPASGEIADLAVSGTTKQTAFVNGAKVQAYWSNNHSAPIIPIDRDYAARLIGTNSSEHTTTERGTFRPDASESKLCDLLPACCLQNRDFSYSLARYDATVKLRVETVRYRAPVFSWSIAGTPVNGNGSVVVNLIVESFNGRIAHYQPQDVTLLYTVTNDSILIRCIGAECNFDVDVSCAVRDGSITGNLKTDVIAKPSLSAGFVGTVLKLDPEYQKEREACLKAAAKMFRDRFTDTRPRRVPTNPGGPVEIDPGILNQVPAFSRLTEYTQARKVLAVAKMTLQVIPSDLAGPMVSALIADTPGLRAAVGLHAARSGQMAVTRS